MPRLTSQFVCQQCNYQTPRWMGQCPNCGTWNSLVETVVAKESTKKHVSRSSAGTSQPVRLSGIKPTEHGRRISTGIAELDQVLGGGMVPGGVMLLAGEPGIGKSTLLLQIADKFGTRDVALGTSGKKEKLVPSNLVPKPCVLYVAGEESTNQIASRAARLGIKNQEIQVLEETDVDQVIEQVNKLVSYKVTEPGNLVTQLLNNSVALIIVDSIQTLTTSDLTGTAGSIGQVRECAGRLTALAKRIGVPLFLVGHVTKEGSIAGPRVLEHMVDTVLWFEGDRRGLLRLVRTIKNRFGPTDEVGIFSMEESGLKEVANPSAMFLSEDPPAGGVPGQVVASVLEGTRPILVEVEALVVPTKLAFPKRAGSGVDPRRLEIIVAVLQRRCGLSLWDYDIYVNVSGGIKVTEPGADLAIALAIASSYKDNPVKAKSFAVGEVGLLGALRPVPQLERRVREAKRQGYTNPITNKEVKTLSEAIRQFVPGK